MNIQILRSITLLVIIINILSKPGLADQKDTASSINYYNLDCDCKQIVDTVKYLIPHAYSEGNKDSIITLINATQNKCGFDVFRITRILLAIESNSFSDSLCDETFLWWRVPNYVFWTGFGCCTCECYTTPGTEMGCEYSEFLRAMANRIANSLDSSKFEYALCKYINGNYFNADTDYLLLRLAHNQFPGTPLQSSYIVALKSTKYNLHIFRKNRALLSGLSLPLDSKNVLGKTIAIGAALGVKLDRLGIDMLGGIHFTQASHAYYEKFGDQLAFGNKNISGAFWGFYPSYEIYEKRRFEMECLAGLGFIDLHLTQKYESKRKVSLSPTWLFFGITQRIYFNKERSRYIGVQIRQNYLTDDKNGETNLARSAISIDLLFGYLGNHDDIQDAKRIRYYDWR